MKARKSNSLTAMAFNLRFSPMAWDAKGVSPFSAGSTILGSAWTGSKFSYGIPFSCNRVCHVRIKQMHHAITDTPWIAQLLKEGV
jgi:hypothetical protein